MEVAVKEVQAAFVVTDQVQLVYERARKGAPKVARLLLTLGPLAVLCQALVVVFSVLAFD